MTKLYSILLMLFVFVCSSAQKNQLSTQGKVLNVSKNQLKDLKKDINALHSTQKGTDSDWYSYAFTVDDSLGNPAYLSSTFLFPDTQITADFGSFYGSPWVHGAATILDPTSAWFNNVTNITIGNNQAYDLDSVGILCSYKRNSATSIVDTLIIEFIVGNSINLPEYYFTGMSMYYGVDTVKFKAVKQTGGLADFATNTIKVPLTDSVANDTTSGGFNYILAAPSMPIHMQAGDLIAMTYQFKPGYSYTQTDTLNNKNYFSMYSYEEQGSNTLPSYSPGDFNSSQIMTVESKFMNTSNWYNFYIPEIAYTQPYGFENHLVDFKLSIDPICFYQENYTICDNGSYYWRGNTYTTAGVYYDSLQTVSGDDSVFQLTLAVNPTYEIITNDSICQGDSLFWSGNYYKTAGVYLDSLQTQSGCDSILKLNLTVGSLPQAVNVTTNPTNGDLSSGNYGEVILTTSFPNDIYFSTKNNNVYSNYYNGTGSQLSLGNTYTYGTYEIWAQSSISGCLIKQGVVTFTDSTIGYNEISENIIFGIYPNPNDGSFTLEINSKKAKDAQVFIYNNIGQLVYSEEFRINSITYKNLDLSSQAKGIYHVHLSTDNGIVYREKVVVQ